MKIKNLLTFTNLLLLAVICCAGLAFKCNDKVSVKDQVKNFRKAVPIELPEQLPPPNLYTTPGGNSVQTYTPIPPEKQAEQFRVVDEGIARAVASTDNQGWSGPLNFNNSPFIVIMRPKMYTSVNGYGLLRMKNGITTAGTVVLLGSFLIEPPSVWIAENYDYPQFTKAAVRHEVEHVLEWYRPQDSRQTFQRFLGAGDVHPHFPMDGDAGWYQSDTITGLKSEDLRDQLRAADGIWCGVPEFQKALAGFGGSIENPIRVDLPPEFYANPSTTKRSETAE